MLQLLKNLKLYIKLDQETVHKYSHQNLFAVITCTYKSIFTVETSQWSTVSSVKPISGVALSGNGLDSMKDPYFDTIISHTLKNAKWLKHLCADSINDHVHQSFDVFSK